MLLSDTRQAIIANDADLSGSAFNDANLNGLIIDGVPVSDLFAAYRRQ